MKSFKLQFDKSSGITLVALVVTMILLIILASIIFHLFIKDSIIKRASDAGKKYQETEEEESNKIYELSLATDKQIEEKEKKSKPSYNTNTGGGKLLPAYQIKQKINSTGANFSNIVEFLMSNSAPTSSDNYAEIQANDSTVKIYSWIDSEGKCYWYSEDKNPLVNPDMVGFFKDCKKLINISGIASWDSSQVTNIKEICKNCIVLESVEPFAGWNIIQLSGNSAEFIFQGCKALRSCNGLQNFRFKNITALHCTFEGCNMLTDISQLKEWGCENVTSLDSTFRDCTSLTSLDGIEDWEIENVSNMYRTFYQCTSLQNIDALSNWGAKVTNVTNMEQCFYRCLSISSLNGLSTWQTSSLRILKNTFAQLKLITSLKALDSWNVSNVTDFSYCFDTCEKLESFDGLENWNVSHSTTFACMFYNTRALKNAVSICNWDVTNNMNFTTMIGGNHNFQFEKAPFTKLNGEWGSNGTYNVA